MYYSDYSIEAIYTSEDKAEEYVTLLKWQDKGESVGIEEWEVDSPRSPQKATKVGMTKDGNAYFIRKVIAPKLGAKRYELFSNGEEVLLTNIVITEDAKRAVKVTNELRTRLIAGNRWHAEGETETCPKCKGTGLFGEDTLCPKCKGKGKVPTV